MNADSQQTSTRYVVSERHEGAIVPGRRDEMGRDVHLLPGADILGGVLARDLFVKSGPVRVRASVYASGSMTIEPSDAPGRAKTNRDVEIDGAVVCPHSILVAKECACRVRFLADLFTDQLRIHGAFVRGNVYARNAIITDSVILGGVFCSGALSLKNVVLSTFRAEQATVKPEVLLFLPYAIADRFTEKPLSLRALSFVDLDRVLDGAAAPGGAVTMNDADIVRVVEEEEDGKPREFSVASIVSRVLDLDALQERYRANKRILEGALLEDPASGREGDAGRDRLRRIEEGLFRLIEHPPAEHVPRRTAIEEVAKRPSFAAQREEYRQLAKL